MIDGIYGAETEQAVRRFQRERGLPADGVVDTATWRELVEAGYTLGDRLLWQSRGMLRGDDVLALQRRLNELGFDAGQEDGIFGPLTRAAVEEFQRNVGLEVDGVVGPETVAVLRRLRLHHQAPGLAVRVRELQQLRGLSGRGLGGSRIVLDAARGVRNPGRRLTEEWTEADVCWAVASRTAARLAARGCGVVLTRGPSTDPTPSQRATVANEHGADLLVSVDLNALPTPTARGAATYYFGSAHGVSEAGRRLAEHVQATLVAAGFVPDCRTHPMAWPLLRETRMPAVVAQPGFATSPDDLARLVQPDGQDDAAGALADAVAHFVADAAKPSIPREPA